MAALLRHGAAAARRLGGSMVRRAEVEGRRRLGTRHMHTHTQEHQQMVNDEIKHVEEELVRELRGHVAVERSVQQKKEELYDVIAKAEHSFWTSSFRNRRLLQLLAVEVKPRPADSEWRRLRFSRWANGLLEAAGLIALIGVVSSGAVRYRSYRQDKMALPMEQEHEARAVAVDGVRDRQDKMAMPMEQEHEARPVAVHGVMENSQEEGKAEDSPSC